MDLVAMVKAQSPMRVSAVTMVMVTAWAQGQMTATVLTAAVGAVAATAMMARKWKAAASARGLMHTTCGDSVTTQATPTRWVALPLPAFLRYGGPCHRCGCPPRVVMQVQATLADKPQVVRAVVADSDALLAHADKLWRTMCTLPLAALCDPLAAPQLSAGDAARLARSQARVLAPWAVRETDAPCTVAPAYLRCPHCSDYGHFHFRCPTAKLFGD
jgi:hypothetical protein